MINAVGREIPEEILERTGKEVFQGNNYKDGKVFQKASPKVTPVMRNDHDKMVKDIHEALVKCNAHDGMTVSFHHHFREGDLVVCMVMEEIHKMGIKNITLSASSLGKAHDALVPMIEDGTILNIESSGVRGKIGDAISHGNRLIMMYEGRIVIDVSGEEKKKLTVPQLLELFSKVSGSDEADDKLLLS